MKRFLSIILLALFTFSFHSCEKYEITIGDDFMDDIQPIFVNKCSSCHPSLLPPDFTEGSVFNSLTQYNGGALIDKETPEDSYILVKATDGHSSNDVSNSQKEAILNWIENGANKQ